MSASSAGTIAALNAVRSQTAPAEKKAGAPAAVDGDATRRATLNTLASYIPSEALAFYLAGIPLLNSLTPTPGSTRHAAAIVLFVVAVAGNSAFLLAAQLRQARLHRTTAAAGRPDRYQVAQFLLAFVITNGSFALYAMTQPNGIVEPSPSWAGYVLLIGVFVLGGLARMFGIKPLEPGADAR